MMKVKFDDMLFHLDSDDGEKIAVEANVRSCAPYGGANVELLSIVSEIRGDVNPDDLNEEDINSLCETAIIKSEVNTEVCVCAYTCGYRNRCGGNCPE